MYMFNKIAKKLVVIVLVLVLLSTSTVGADSRKASADEIDLTKTVEQFFTDWLIKRDVQAAMRYVSSKAILCNKELPEEFQSKDKLSQEDVNKIVEQIFSQILKYAQSGDKLESSISSSYDFVALTDDVISIEHSERKLFELFVLNITEGKTAQDFGFICKFDETPAFREAVGKPTCYYVMTNVLFSSAVTAEAQIDKFPFEMVLVKETGGWRILTVGVIED